MEPGNTITVVICLFSVLACIGLLSASLKVYTNTAKLYTEYFKDKSASNRKGAVSNGK